MKKAVKLFRIGLLLMVGISLISACATVKKTKPVINKENTDWEKLNLIGNVKAVNETSTTKYPDEEAKIKTSKYTFNRYGKQVLFEGPKYSHKSVYNAEGKILEQKQYFENRLEKKITYNYSSEGKRTGKSTYMTPTFQTKEEWEAHEANKKNLPNEGLYLQNRLDIQDNGNQTITVYKENKEIDHIQYEVYKGSKLVEISVKYPFSEVFGYKKTWKYDEDDNLKKFKKYVGSAERLELIWEYDYDENDRIVKETYLRYMPKSSSSFNENGHLKEQINAYYLDEEISAISSFQYDAHGSLISKKRKKYNGELAREITYELTYDSNQNLIQENVHDSKKASVNNYMEYDENANEIYYKSVDANGDLIAKVTRKFDSVSNMIERAVYKADESISLKESYVYNANNNVSKHIVEKPLEETIEIKTRDYDHKGNWIKFELKFLSSINNELFQQVIKEREIVYFE